MVLAIERKAVPALQLFQLLPDLLFSALAFADVAVDRIDADLPAAMVNGRAEQRDVEPCAILALAYGLYIDLLALSRLCAQCLPFVAQILGDGQFPYVTSYHIFTSVAEHPQEFAVDAQHPTFHVEHHDGLRRALEQFVEQGCLRPKFLPDVGSLIQN